MYRVLINKASFSHSYLKNIMLQLQNNIKKLGDLKMMLLNVSIVHIQLHIYGFSWTVSLFGSSRSTETYLGGKELRFEFREITVRQSSSNLHIRMLKWHGCINKYVFYISFAFVNTIG